MANTFKCTGTVHEVGETVKFASGFAKRTLVVRLDGDGKFIDYAAFDFTRSKDGKYDGTRKLDGLRKGQRVEVAFRLSAFESKAKPGVWMGSCRGFDVQTDAPEVDIPVAAVPPPATADEPMPDDMPF